MTSDAEQARPAGRTPPPDRRPALTREQVLTAALQIIDEDGVEALTMRRLGQALARNPMAVYRHAADKDALLDDVVEHVAAELVAPRRPDRNGHEDGHEAGDVSGEGDHEWEAVLRRTAQIQALVATFSVYGFLLAAFALVQGLSSTTRLYWLRTPRFGGWIYGPYVNHNHYAGLMEMLVPIPLVFSLTRGARGSRKTMAGIAAALMAGTIFLSGSRGGMVAFLVQAGVLALAVLRGQRSRTVTRALLPFLLIGVGLVLWLGGNELAQRLETIHTETQAELSGGLRLEIDRDALRMFARKPILGWGMGVFPDVYPEFRSFHTNFFINEAHNDYLQLLVEMGGMGFATMLWFLWLLFRNAGRKLQHWPEDTNGAVGLAAMLGVTGILVHSLVDFNLQIPANAALFYVLCVVAAMESRFGKTRRKSVRRVSQVEQTPRPDYSGPERREGLQEPI